MSDDCAQCGKPKSVHRPRDAEAHRREAICPQCGEPWKIHTTENGFVETYDPVEVIADMIERDGCWHCQLKKKVTIH